MPSGEIADSFGFRRIVVWRKSVIRVWLNELFVAFSAHRVFPNPGEKVGMSGNV